MELLDISGVGHVTAQLLTEAGITTVSAVADADAMTLASVRGIGPVSAESIKAEAVRLVGIAEPEPAGDLSPPSSDRERRGKDLRKRAKKLRKLAKQQTKKAKSVQSTKKRKRLKNKAVRLEKAARKARRKSKKLLAG